MGDYELFLQMHQQQRPLVIANAWNVKSARLIEQSGFGAVATSSGAIADSLGYEDGEKIPFSEMFYIIKRIRSCISIPLTVDFESGYSNDLRQINENVRQLLDIGVAGINIEDSQGEEIYLSKLSSIRNYLEQKNAKLFINARTDAFLRKLGSPLELTVKRAKLYQEAGADGLFVTAAPDKDTIKIITSATTLPVNVVATPTFPSVEALAECGVRRISMAVSLFRATYKELEQIAGKIKTDSSFESLF